MATTNPNRDLFKNLLSIRAWLIIAVYVSAMIILGFVLERYVNRDFLRSIVVGSGIYGILLFGLIEYLYVVFVPVYNTNIHLAAGYIFGGYAGWLINFIATTAGLFTIILLVR